MNKIIHEILQKPLDKITVKDGEIVQARVEEMIELLAHYPVEEFQYEMELLLQLCNDVLDFNDGKVKSDKSPTFGGLKLVGDLNE